MSDIVAKQEEGERWRKREKDGGRGRKREKEGGRERKEEKLTLISGERTDHGRRWSWTGVTVSVLSLSRVEVENGCNLFESEIKV